jgi:hypothetical protein
MSTPANQLPAPMLDPSQYPSYLDAQRKSQIAQMLMSAMQSQGQAPTMPNTSNPYAVMPRRSPLQSVSQLATALMAGKAAKDASTAQQQYFQGLYGGQQPSSSAPSTGPGAGIISPDASPDAQAAAQAVTDMPPKSGLVQPAPAPAAAPRNPLIPPGMTPGAAQAMLGMMGPEGYAKTFLAPQYQTPEIVAQIRSAGLDPSSAAGQQIQRDALAKATTNLQDVRPGSTLYDVNRNNPLFTGPDNGINTIWQNGQPSAAPVPGAAAATEAMQKAKTVGTQTATPIKLGVDENGKDIYGYAAPPGAGALNATAPGATASPGSVQSQKAGADAGQAYASELAKNAAGATEVRRSLSELKNLSQQATPSAANDAKAKLGAFMIAAGADPDTVSKWTGVDTGALQAAQKQTATLAVNSIHSMTSRGTNFDLDTFMRNNPNMNMADPAAFSRVADYMGNKASQDIAKQKDFAQWKKTSGVSPDDWETQHTAHWLDLQNQAIDKGQSNSARPAPPGQHSLADLQAEIARRGLKPPGTP